MGPRPTTATISKRSARAAAWQRLFGSDTVQILSPVPLRGELPGLGLREVYRVDIAALSREQFDRIAREMSDNFGVPLAEVIEGLRGPEGLPILAEDVTVAFDARFVADDEEEFAEDDDDDLEITWT